MEAALGAFVVRGLNHNIGFLAAIVTRPRFREARLSTDFIPAEFPDGFHGVEPTAEALEELVALVAVARLRAGDGDAGEASVLVGPPPRIAHEVTVAVAGDGAYTVASGDQCRAIRTRWNPHEPLFTAEVDGRAVSAQIERKGIGWLARVGGATIQMRVVTRRTGALAALMPVKLAPDMSRFLLSPMPGLLVSVAVQPGQPVKSGEALAVVEAMKMENVLRAERDGTVKEIVSKPGESLAVDQVILEFA
jgi:propionyl-CoA carboxylase alpha chain